jgi:putative hydrolase of the HAD superfamily
MIRGVIFDLGSTLLDFEGDWEQVISNGIENMSAYFAGRGYPMPVSFAENFRALREMGRTSVYKDDIEYTTEQILNDTLAQHNICWIPDAMLPLAVEKYFEPEEAHWVLFHDVRATLEILRDRGYKLGVLSNATDHALVERLTRNAKIAEYFDPLLTSAKIVHRKPDPRAYQPILNQWQLPPTELVMVGDAASFDILGAHRAGMRGILIQPEASRANAPHAEFEDADLMEPDAVITQLGELPDTILELDKKDSRNA